LDNSEKLGKMVLESDVMEFYRSTKNALENDKDAQLLIKSFNEMKSHYEDIQRFGRYHPDYNEIMRKVRSTKREMDMNDKVATFKIAERNLQRLLDDISGYLAQSVSEQIKAPKDGAALTDTGCGHGGACGCNS